MKLTPKDFFLNIAVMATLYVSAFSFLALLFKYIVGSYNDPYSSGISFAIASLIIIFPLFIFFTRLLNQDIRRNPEKGELGIRKWLVYITLFIAGVTITVDFIVLLNTFLSGSELTIGFLLKVLAVIVVIGGIFLYYFLDLKHKWEREERLSKTIGAFVAISVLVSIVAGFFILGSPQSNRLLRIDVEKVSDLQSIQWQIVNFWQQKERLPNELSELKDPLVGFSLPSDPQTGEEYTYKKVSSLSFELCAVFNIESLNDRQQRSQFTPLEKSVPAPGFNQESWAHGEGDVCFTRTVDPERFPALKQ